MKIVICPDSFKGSLDAEEVASIISLTLKDHLPQVEIKELPLADGGEGTSSILRAFSYPLEKLSNSQNTLRQSHSTPIYFNKSMDKAFIETAKIIGLPLLKPSERNPLNTTSYGVGETIKDSINLGSKEILLSLGGSATCDGGIGMAISLGYKFLDSNNREIEGFGKDLDKIVKIKSPKFNLNTKFKALCDVGNPLLGIKGAAEVFAPQKGATKEEVKILERGLSNLVKVCQESGLTKSGTESLWGAGAAGGLGFAVMVFLKGELFAGIDYILDVLNFDKIIEDANLIITGEGKIDRQSLMGKVLSGIIKRSKGKNIPVISLAGIVEDKEELLKKGLKDVLCISDPNKPVEENMNKNIAKQNLIHTISKLTKSDIFKQIIK